MSKNEYAVDAGFIWCIDPVCGSCADAKPLDSYGQWSVKLRTGHVERLWTGISAVLAIYVGVTVLGMVLVVNFGLKGTEKVKSGFLERHGRSVTGIVLIVLGVLSYLMQF